MVRPAGQAIPAGTPGGPADLTETLRASVEAAKANRTKDAPGKPPAPAKTASASKPRKPAAPRRKATA